MRPAGAGFFESVAYIWNQFVGSFTVDYNAVGDGGTESLNVWVGLGRDQVQIIKELVEQHVPALP